MTTEQRKMEQGHPITGWRTWERPRREADEWEEASADSRPRPLAYALWLQLWHSDADSEFGRMLKETRRPGYDGEIT